MTNAHYRQPLPGTALDYFDAREAVNAIANLVEIRQAQAAEKEIPAD